MNESEINFRQKSCGGFTVWGEFNQYEVLLGLGYCSGGYPWNSFNTMRRKEGRKEGRKERRSCAYCVAYWTRASLTTPYAVTLSLHAKSTLTVQVLSGSETQKARRKTPELKHSRSGIRRVPFLRLSISEIRKITFDKDFRLLPNNQFLSPTNPAKRSQHEKPWFNHSNLLHLVRPKQRLTAVFLAKWMFEFE